MTDRLSLRLGLAGLLLAAAGLAVAAPPNQTASAAPVRIGLVQSLFHDVPLPLVRIMAQPFAALMRQHTGLNGEMIPAGDALELARELHEDKYQLAVFHGVEFAWAQSKYPDLQPLMVAIYKQRNLVAHLVVNKSGGIEDVAELRGKDLAIPRKTKEPCRIFVERNVQACGGEDCKAFFGQVVNPENIEVALDDVSYGTTHATVVDNISLECYGRLKPGHFARLKVIKDSEPFPPGVIAYRKGALDDAQIRRFRTGMVAAGKTDRGRDLMNMWKITAFEPVPADYARSLAEILKAYPPPESKVSARTPAD